MNSPYQKQENFLTVRNVAFCYGRKGSLFSKSQSNFWALKDVSFDLNRGEALGVIGRNGAGKSTLLRLLAGITQPDKGTITKNGCSTSLLSLQVGFVPYLTGRKNAFLSGLLLGLTYQEIKKQMETIIEFSELGDFINQPIKTYSSGMVARLAFSVAHFAEPDVLLIDEVLGVGDADFRKKSTKVMKEKIKSNKTVVMVSHGTPLVKELCEKSVWIHDGISIAMGETEHVIKEYEDFLKSPKYSFGS